jgi:hypothetical protein
VVTAGHCTFGTGLNGEPTESGSGGNDVWISFAEEPDYSILPPSEPVTLPEYGQLPTLGLLDQLYR